MKKIYLKKLNCCAMESKEKERYFKELNICENFNSYFMKSDIKSKNVKLKINCAKIINTIEGESLEGQYLSGKKLIIIGKVCTELFIANVNNNYPNCYYIEREIPFSTFIIIPRDVCDKEDIHLEYFIEDISIINVTRKKILLSVTFLIEFKEDFLDDNN